MGMVFVQKHLVFVLVFVFLLNPQLSFSSSSSSNVTLPSNNPLILCHPLQSQALLQFISISTIGPYAYYRSYPKPESWNWKEGTDCCYWHGVTCDDVTGHVIGLDLSFSNVQIDFESTNKTLFSSHIAPHLQSLNLAGNNFFDSEITSEFWVMFVRFGLSNKIG